MSKLAQINGFNIVGIVEERTEENPNHVRILEGGWISEPYKFKGDAILELCGSNIKEVTIETECPIQCRGNLTICGEGTLILRNTAHRQPCIGPKTYDNMSYGRWEYAGPSNLVITIDGVKVICESPVEAFTLGSYGEVNPPKVIFKNGGCLEAPETRGNRVLVESFTKPDASTKIEDDPVYAIVKPGEAIPFSEQYKQAELDALQGGVNLIKLRDKHFSSAQLRAIYRACKKGFTPEQLYFVDNTWSADCIIYAALSLACNVPDARIVEWNNEIFTDGGIGELRWLDKRVSFAIERVASDALDKFQLETGIPGSEDPFRFFKWYFKEYHGITAERVPELDLVQKQFWYALANPWGLSHQDDIDTALVKYYLE